MTAQPDLFPATSARRCPLCGGSFTKGCMRCYLHTFPLPPLSDAEYLALDREHALEEARLSRLRVLGRPARLALVSCSDTKLAGSHPARQLYSSPLFRKSLAYAESTADEVRIVSALYGIVHPDRIIDSYDQRLPQRQAEVAIWGVTTRNSIAMAFPRMPLHLIFLTGLRYADPIITAGLPEGWTYELPLEGLQIGERLSFLAKALRSVPAGS